MSSPTASPPAPAGRRRHRVAALQGAQQPVLSAGDLFREWRDDVDTQQENTARILQQVLLGMERLNSRSDEQQRRIDMLESAPDRNREAHQGERNLSTQYALVACGILTALAYLLPHLTFH